MNFLFSVEKITETPDVVAPPLLSPDKMFQKVFPSEEVELGPGDEYALQCSPKNLNANVTWFVHVNFFLVAFEIEKHDFNATKQWNDKSRIKPRRR